jgi:hypothetical protein
MKADKPTNIKIKHKRHIYYLSEANECDFYENTVAAMLASNASHQSYLDIAIEVGSEHSVHPWVVLPSQQWVDAARFRSWDAYPMFPESSPGAGGITFKSVVATRSGLLPLNPLTHQVGDGLPKIKVYSVWAHKIADANECARVPTLVSRKNGITLVNKSWFYDRLPGLLTLWDQIQGATLASGIRIEIRLPLSFLHDVWSDMADDLVEILKAVLLSIVVGRVRKHSVLNKLWEYLHGAHQGGLFNQVGTADGFASHWKADQYHLILAAFGLTHKMWSRHVNNMLAPIVFGRPPAGLVPAGPIGSGPMSMKQVDILNPVLWQRALLVADLTVEELAAYHWLVQKRRSGRSRSPNKCTSSLVTAINQTTKHTKQPTDQPACPRSFPYYVMYMPPYGDSTVQPRSQQYSSLTALAR